MDRDTIRAIANIVDEVATRSLSRSEMAYNRTDPSRARAANEVYVAFDMLHSELLGLLKEDEE